MPPVRPTQPCPPRPRRICSMQHSAGPECLCTQALQLGGASSATQTSTAAPSLSTTLTTIDDIGKEFEYCPPSPDFHDPRPAPMRSSLMLQHYRMKQRNYLQWRSDQNEKRNTSCYYPPQLRSLRNDYFVKRYEKYGKKKPVVVVAEEVEEQEEEYPYSLSEEYEALAHKVWKWLNQNHAGKDEGEDVGVPTGFPALQKV